MLSSFRIGLFGQDTNALVTASLAVFIAMLVAVSFKGRRGALPPGPRGVPLLGYLPFLGKELHREFEKLARVYGPIYSLWLGNKLCVVVSSPELVKEVVRSQDTVFANRDPTISTTIGSYGRNSIAFGSYGPEWKKLRKVFAQELMTKRTLDNSYELRREEVQKSVRQIYEMRSTEIDFGSLSFATSTNTVLSMVGSSSFHAGVDVPRFKAALAELMVLFGSPNISDLFPFLARFDLQGVERDTNKVVAVVGGFLDSTIDQKRKVGTKQGVVDHSQQKKDFLEFLLELHEKNGDEEMSISRTQVKALLSDTLIGGTDTTTTMVEWTMAELLKHPEQMKKVQEELTDVVGLSSLVEESHLPRLLYLTAIIKETLRLHPALPFLIPRSPSSDATLGGYTVPKGSKVFLNIGAIQRDPEIWESPLEFRPERFMGDAKRDYTGNDFGFLPFGSGRRICSGIPLAEKITSFVLASFLHSFEWRLPYHVDELGMSDKFGIVVKKLEPLIAIPTPRLSKLELYI